MKRIEYWGIIESNKSENVCILILLEKKSHKHIPIAIGRVEAQHLLILKNNHDTPTPLPVALVCSILSSLNCKVEKVQITAMTDGIYTAEILTKNHTTGETHAYPARVSDALAAALHYTKPIYIEDTLIETYGVTQSDIEEGLLHRLMPNATTTEQTIEELQAELLEAVNTEDYERAALLRDLITQIKST